MAITSTPYGAAVQNSAYRPPRWRSCDLKLLVAGGVAAPAAGLAIVVGLLMAVWLSIRGDVIPAIFYAPTLVIGIALLAG